MHTLPLNINVYLYFYNSYHKQDYTWLRHLLDHVTGGYLLDQVADGYLHIKNLLITTSNKLKTLTKSITFSYRWQLMSSFE